MIFENGIYLHSRKDRERKKGVKQQLAIMPS